MKKIKQQQTIVLMALSLLFIIQARAVDGVIEINQTCATQTGCFSGDSAGFPVRISNSAPGSSFKLTSDLVFPDGNSMVIEVIRRNTTIDLNGFSIIRQDCYSLNSNQQCTRIVGTRSAIGNIAGSPNMDRMVVKNGAIIGAGQEAIDTNVRYVTVENMRILYSGGDGIHLLNYSTVKNCIIAENAGHGISATTNVYISQNQIVNNGQNGVEVGSDSQIFSNYIANNGQNGVQTRSGAQIFSNKITSNTENGIRLIGSTTNAALIKDNVITRNDLRGISISTNNASTPLCAYMGNVIDGNFSGTVSSDCYDLGQNFCTSNNVCP